VLQLNIVSFINVVYDVKTYMLMLQVCLPTTGGLIVPVYQEKMRI